MIKALVLFWTAINFNSQVAVAQVEDIDYEANRVTASDIYAGDSANGPATNYQPRNVKFGEGLSWHSGVWGWNAGVAPDAVGNIFLQFELPASPSGYTITNVRARILQLPDGYTMSYRLDGSFDGRIYFPLPQGSWPMNGQSGVTYHGTFISFSPTPIAGVRFLRLVALSGASWVAFGRIYLEGIPSDVDAQAAD